jgi:hypothetical protein
MMWPRPALALAVAAAAALVAPALALSPSPAAAAAKAPAAAPPPAASAPTAASTAAAMTEAASKFLAALSPAQKERGQHPFDGEAPGDGRESFKYVPLLRTGIPLKSLDPAQRQLAHALLKTGLSAAGYLKATQIIELETVLAELERNPVRRDPENYYVWVFGQPQAGSRSNARWGWKFEGHHVSLNFTLVDGTAIASVPSFFGANPAEVPSGKLAGRRVLQKEEDEARQLILGLDDKLRAKAIFDAKAPPDLVTGDKLQVSPLPEVGLEVAAMPAPQRELVRRLLAIYADSLPAPLAAVRLARINQAGFEKVRFGWAGATERHKPHYYRLSGPTFILEYDCTQDGANHIHTVWRDYEGDFGRDLLREHLKTAH